MAGPPLVLASVSPQRSALLRDAGYAFEVVPADVDESSYPASLLPSGIARHLAIAKARAVAPRHPGSVVLAADTVVAFGDTPLGKPADAADAARMLDLLAGTTHLCITGVAVVRVDAGFERDARAMTAVRMQRLTPRQIAAYVASGLWRGKAGGYGIQDDDPFVTAVTGSRSNVVGLPMELASELLADAGVFPAEPPAG